MLSTAPFSNPVLYNDYYTYDYHIPEHLNTTLPINPKAPEQCMKRTAPEFIFKNQRGITLKPLYDLHHQRHVVYWDLERGVSC